LCLLGLFEETKMMGRPQQFLGASVAMMMSLPMTARAEAPARRDAPSDAPLYDANTCTYTMREVLPPSGAVPSNLPFIEFTPVRIGGQAGTAELVRRGTSERIPLRPEYDPYFDRLRFFLEAPMIEGETYDFVDPVCASRPRETTTYTVTAPIPEPTSLGTLNAYFFAQYRALGYPPSYVAQIRLFPDASVRPWFGAYQWRLEGFAPYSGERVLFEDDASLYFEVPIADCPRGTTPGPIEGRARRIGGTTEISTTSTVATPCNDLEVVGPDGRPLTPEQIRVYEEAHRTGTFADTGPSSIDGGLHTEPDTNPNCSASNTRASSGFLALVLSTLAVIITRRRHAL
jgi:hypothetical protein